MAPYGISDKDFTENIIKNLPRQEAVKYPVSRNLLLQELKELFMDSENDFKRKEERAPKK